MGDIPQLHWGHGHDFSDRDRFSGQRFCCFTQMDIPRPGWRKSVMGQHFRGRLRQIAVVVVLAVAGVGAISGTAQAAPNHDDPRYSAGAPGSGDAVLPVRRQRRVRRPALRPRPPLHAADQSRGARRPPQRGRDCHPPREAGPGVAQLRPARPRRHVGPGRRQGRQVVPGAGRREPHLGTHDRAAAETEGRTDDDDRRSSTAEPPAGRSTPPVRSTGGSPPPTARWSSTSPRVQRPGIR